MTERDLSTMLRDHLGEEPPVRSTSADAISTGRRQGRRVLALTGGACAAALAVAVAVVPGLVAGDTREAGATREPAATAPQPTTSIIDRLDWLANARLAPYVGVLGPASWAITDAGNQPVDSDDPDAQAYRLHYRPNGTQQVNLYVVGYRPDDFQTYRSASTCASMEREGLSVDCEQETLPDGSIVTTSVGAQPGDGIWSRSVSLTTPNGVAIGASEYVRADSPETADWKVPVDVLSEVALDTDLRHPGGVAHAPVPVGQGGVGPDA